MTSRRTGIVVPHTHWDRAWYLPFQAYRLRLVEMIAALLELLEHGDLPAFVLDGQTVLLEDHLAIRPQDGPRIRALVEAGRLRLGPWYTMPDCFLARPESLIRNLHRGLRTATDHGGASRVGYVPDSFGHFAQLPQILAGFGIDSFLFMRGMPADVRDRHGGVFVWRAPDGSEVLATFLREGYFPLGALGQESFHGRYDGLPPSEERARDRLSATLARILPMQTQPVVVLPAGGDHLPARGDLVPLVEHLNRSQGDVQLRFGVFEDYLAALRAATSAAPPAVYQGDLLGQADHPLLRNVLSARIDLKILNHRAQSLLTRVVEPLMAWAGLHGLPGVPPALMQHAWDALLKNHAHDDICGCSVDDVHLDDVQRFHDVLALGRELVTRQVEHLVQHRLPPAPHARSTRVFAFNPHPWPVVASATVRILLPDEGGEFSAESAARRITAADAAGDEIPVRVLSTSCKAIRSRYLETTWGRAYEIHAALPLPPLGFEVFTVSETPEPLVLAAVEQPEAVPAALIAAVRFELDADLGDGYSHGPCPELPVHRAEMLSARADGRLPDVFHLRYQISGPASIDREGLAGRPLDACLGPQVTTTIAVRAERRWASPAASRHPAATDAPRDAGSRSFTWIFDISFTNVFSDSRLRIVVDPVLLAGEGCLGTSREVVADGQAMWCPLPAIPAVHDLWDGPLAAPAYPGEKPYPVHHTNDGIVWSGDAGAAFCGGVGLHEFELVTPATPGPPAAAFTLYRAVGSLSVRGGRIRSCQAGPQRATPAAQMLTRLEHVVVCGSAPRVSDAMRRLKEALHPCWVEEAPVVPAMSTPVEPTLAASMLEIGDTPLEVMALKPAAGGGVVVRLLNPTAEPVTVALGLPCLPAGPCAAERLMLDETTTLTSTRFDARRRLDLAFAPFEIQTWKLQPC